MIALKIIGWIILLLIGMAFIGTVSLVVSERLRWRVVAWMESLKYYMKTPVKQPEESYLLKDTLSVISVEDFIEVAVNDNTDKLIITGNPSQDIVDAAWLSLLDQYYTAVKSEQNEQYIEYTRKIAKITLRVNTIDWVCKAIEISAINKDQNTIDKLCETLAGYGYKGKITVDNYEAKTKVIINKEKRNKAILSRLKKELEHSMKSSSKEATKDDYYKVIADIRKHNNYPDSPHVLAKKWSMETYALELSLRYEDIAAQKKQLENYGSTEG